MNQLQELPCLLPQIESFEDIRTYIPIIQNIYLVLDLPDSYQ